MKSLYRLSEAKFWSAFYVLVTCLELALHIETAVSKDLFADNNIFLKSETDLEYRYCTLGEK